MQNFEHVHVRKPQESFDSINPGPQGPSITVIFKEFREVSPSSVDRKKFTPIHRFDIPVECTPVQTTGPSAVDQAVCRDKQSCSELEQSYRLHWVMYD